MVLRPTAALPAVKTRPSFEELSNALSLVEYLYASFPEIPLIPDVSPNGKDSTAAASNTKDDADGAAGGVDEGSDDDPEDDDILRADDFEAEFSHAWLLRLAVRPLDWLDPDQAERIRNRAAKAISDACKLDDDGALDREFEFPMRTLEHFWTQAGIQSSGRMENCEGEGDVYTKGANAVGMSKEAEVDLLKARSIVLRDEALPPATSEGGNQETTEGAIASRAQNAATAVGLQTWAAAAVLCDYLARFWTPPRGNFQTRVLELGAGTGLVGLLAAKMALDDPQPNVQVVLTDYHERVLTNLRHNIDLNFPLHSECVRADVLDWAEVDDFVRNPSSWERGGTTSGLEPWWMKDVRSGGYDLILGADVMYSPEHATWLASSLAAMIPAQNSRPGAEGHILCAIRNKGRFAAMQLVEAADRVFHQAVSPSGVASHLEIAATYRLPKVRGLGRADEHGWVHWVFRVRNHSK